MVKTTTMEQPDSTFQPTEVSARNAEMANFIEDLQGLSLSGVKRKFKDCTDSERIETSSPKQSRTEEPVRVTLSRSFD